MSENQANPFRKPTDEPATPDHASAQVSEQPIEQIDEKQAKQEPNVEQVNSQPETRKKSSSIIGRIDRMMSVNLQADNDPEAIPEMSEAERYYTGVIGSLVGLLISGVIEFIQALMVCSDEKCDGLRGFAVALGSVTSFVCFVILAVNWFKQEQDSNTVVGECVLPYLSIFLALWWVVGVVMCTFEEPFEETGNGYFACWVALILSLNFCQITISKFGAMIFKCKNDLGTPEQRAMVIIIFFSFIEAYACILQLDEYNAAGSTKASSQEYWGLSCGLISGGLVIITVIIEAIFHKGFSGLLSYILVPLWLFGAGVVTFDEPFTETGNGYFCAWGAFCMSCYLLYHTQSKKEGSALKKMSNIKPSNPPLR